MPVRDARRSDRRHSAAHCRRTAGIPNARTLAGASTPRWPTSSLRRPELLVFGEDVGRKGGVYNVTNGLQRRFGPARVFDTLLDETSDPRASPQGAAHIGLLPIPEIQYLAYVHNALDQLRGEAATLQFFSSGQFRNPMVVRVPGLAYQKGFGGHFHNDNSVGALRDIPGLVLAVPARGDDAARMLRGAIAMAAEDGRVVVFLEPIALYHEKDLHDRRRRRLADRLPRAARGAAARRGRHLRTRPMRTIRPADRQLRQRPAPVASRRRNASPTSTTSRARVIDLRWLNPLPTRRSAAQASGIGTVVVVDECRATGGGVADAIIADLAEHKIAKRLASVRAVD